MRKEIKMSLLLLLCLIFAVSAISCNDKKGDNNDNELKPRVNNYIDLAEVKHNETGLTWPDEQMIPSTAPMAETLDAVFTSSFAGADINAVVALQGLVNREKPRIIVQASPNEGVNTWPIKTFNFKFGEEYKGSAKAWDIFVKYKDYIKGFVIYDPKRDATMNLAVTIAGLKDALPVSERTMNKLKEKGIDVPIVEDLRDKFTDDLSVYQYLYDTYWKDCTKRILVSLAPGDYGFMRDMAIAAKCAVIWLDAGNQDHAPLLKKFLGDLEPGKSIILGWWPKESTGIKIGSEFGIPTVPADYFENMTVYASMRQPINQPKVPDKPELQNKIYVAVLFTDGDNIQYNEHSMRTATLWENKNRGQMPINWTISPALSDAAPGMMNYYFETATDNDCMIAGPSGMAYGMMEFFDNNAVEKQAKWTEIYMAKTGIRATTVFEYMLPEQHEIYSKYSRTMFGYTVQQYNKEKDKDYNIYNNKPVVPCYPRYSHTIEDIFDKIKERVEKAQFDGSKPLFLSVYANAWKIGPKHALTLRDNVIAEYGDKVEFIRLDHMLMLISESENKPYNLCLSKNTVIKASDTTTEPKLAGDGTPSKDSKWISSKEGEKWLSFDLGGEYNISRYVVKHAGAGGMERSKNTKDFRLEASEDGTNWTTVDVVKNNTSNVTDIDFETPIKAKHLRLVIENPGADGTAIIGEVEIYGAKA